MYDNILKENEIFYKNYNTLKRNNKILTITDFILKILFILCAFCAIFYCCKLNTASCMIFFFLSLLFIYLIYHTTKSSLKIKSELFIYDFLISKLDLNFENEYLERLRKCKDLLTSDATFYQVQREYIVLFDIFKKDFVKLSFGAYKQAAIDLKFISKEMLNCKLK